MKQLLSTASVSFIILALVGCGPTDVGQTTGTGPTAEQKIADIEKSAAPQAVKDRSIADIRAHEEAYQNSKK
ncbi:hypothetical protein BH11ARM2_BH11ARM2_26890 [soil metagenome]